MVNTRNLIKSLTPRPQTLQPIASDMFIPNHSGISSHPEFKKAISEITTTGATGSFTAASGETVTVVNGIITFITSSTFFLLLENGDFILLETGDKILNG